MKRGANPTTRRRSKASANGSASYRERRREIAQVAAELFNKHGFRGTSLAAVAKALGTDRASLYYYIADKRELFDEVVREVAEAHVVAAERVLESAASPLEKLRTLVVSLMTSYGENYPLLYVHMRENLSHAEAERSTWSLHMRDVNRRYEKVFIEILQAGIADGTVLPLASPRILAFGIIGMIGWTNRWFNPRTSVESADEIGNAYVKLVINGLAAPAAAIAAVAAVAPDAPAQPTRRAPKRRKRAVAAAPAEEAANGATDR